MSDPYFEPEWCERCGGIGHNGLTCTMPDYDPEEEDNE
jgi:hypothetical protein